MTAITKRTSNIKPTKLQMEETIGSRIKKLKRKSMNELGTIYLDWEMLKTEIGMRGMDEVALLTIEEHIDMLEITNPSGK